MRAATIGLILGLALAGFGGAALSQPRDRAPDPPTAGPLDAAAVYSGLWYEQARTPTSVSRGCGVGTTEHRRDGARWTVRDACVVNGRERSISGAATLLDPGQNAEMRVVYRWGIIPIPRTYRIILISADLSWFVSAEPGFERVYIYTRAATPGRALVDRLIERTRAMGYRGEWEVPAT